MRVHLKRRAHVGVTELSLCHFQRRAEFMEQRAVRVPERAQAGRRLRLRKLSDASAVACRVAKTNTSLDTSWRRER